MVLIKNEEPYDHPVKVESEFCMDYVSNMNTQTVMNDDSPKTSKYNGRGRPRKGQVVVKQKRIPKPPQLEMCQICGQLFKCIKTHMFVHDTQPRFECHHCGRKFKHKPNLICHVKNHQNVRYVISYKAIYFQRRFEYVCLQEISMPSLSV